MAGTRRAQRSLSGDRETVRTAWQLVACVPLVLLVVGLGVRAGLEADRDGADQRPAAGSAERKNDRQSGQAASDGGAQSVVATSTSLRRDFQSGRKFSPRDARERCEKAGIDPADLSSMSECIADLTD